MVFAPNVYTLYNIVYFSFKIKYIASVRYVEILLYDEISHNFLELNWL